MQKAKRQNATKPNANSKNSTIKANEYGLKNSISLASDAQFDKREGINISNFLIISLHNNPLNIKKIKKIPKPINI